MTYDQVINPSCDENLPAVKDGAADLFIHFKTAYKQHKPRSKWGGTGEKLMELGGVEPPSESTSV